MKQMTLGSLFAGIGGYYLHPMLANSDTLLCMKTFSAETRAKMSEAAKKRCKTAAFRAQVDKYHVPFCLPEELKRDYVDEKMSQLEIAAKYGVTLKRVQTAFRRCSITPRPQIKRDQTGPNNAYWGGKDGELTYAALHKRVEALRGRPRKCEVCGTTSKQRTYDWANMSGRYDDPADYQRMCRSCHWKHDKKILNIHRMRKGVPQCQQSN